MFRFKGLCVMIDGQPARTSRSRFLLEAGFLSRIRFAVCCFRLAGARRAQIHPRDDDHRKILRHSLCLCSSLNTSIDVHAPASQQSQQAGPTESASHFFQGGAHHASQRSTLHFSVSSITPQHVVATPLCRPPQFKITRRGPCRRGHYLLSVRDQQVAIDWVDHDYSAAPSA